jgi:hypothetical protein
VTVEEIRALAADLRRMYPGDRNFEDLAHFAEQHAEQFATASAVSVPVANDVANAVANTVDVANTKPPKRDRATYMKKYMRKRRAAERKAAT